MSRYTSDVAFSPAVKAWQEKSGSRAGYARMEQKGGWKGGVTRTGRLPGRAGLVLHGNRQRRRPALHLAPRWAQGLPEGVG
jgi:hypothetical protein